MSRFPPKIRPVQEEEDRLWVPYTDNGMFSLVLALWSFPVELTRYMILGLELEHSCEQPSHITTVYNCFCELSKIVHGSLYRVHCAARRPTV